MTVGDDGASTSVVGAMALTVIVAVAIWPSELANTIAVPAASAVTSPSFATDTTFGAPDVQVTARWPSTLPPASSATADKRVVAPISSVAVLGSIRNVAIGDAVTVMFEVPVFPSLVIVIVAVPGAVAVTVPVDDTLATLTLLLL
jgi:hypothetical protein